MRSIAAWPQFARITSTLWPKASFPQAGYGRAARFDHSATRLRRFRAGRHHRRSRFENMAVKEAGLRRVRQSCSVRLHPGFEYVQPRYRRDRICDLAAPNGDREPFLQPSACHASTRGGKGQARRASEVIATRWRWARSWERSQCSPATAGVLSEIAWSAPYLREAHFLVEEGASVEQVNQALYDFGMAMGPLAMDDLERSRCVARRSRGVQTFRKTWRASAARSRTALPSRADMGRRPAADGRRYDADRKPSPDPETAELIETDRPRTPAFRADQISSEEIVDRCIYALINEGARILEEGDCSALSRHRYHLSLRLRLPCMARADRCSTPTRWG